MQKVRLEQRDRMSELEREGSKVERDGRAFVVIVSHFFPDTVQVPTSLAVSSAFATFRATSSPFTKHFLLRSSPLSTLGP